MTTIHIHQQPAAKRAKKKPAPAFRVGQRVTATVTLDITGVSEDGFAYAELTGHRGTRVMLRPDGSVIQSFKDTAGARYYRNCLHCNEAFETDVAAQKYCQRSCYKAAYDARHRENGK